MMWRVKVGDSIKGPFARQQLVTLILQDKIPASTLLQSENSSEWVYADDVPGLFKAAERRRAKQETDENVGSSDVQMANSHRELVLATTKWKRSVTRRDVILAVMGLAVFMATGFGIWFASGPEPFPITSPDLVIRNVSRLAQIRPPKPGAPTLDLPVGALIPVPGVEKMPWAKCPSLSNGLCELVFIAPIRGNNEVFYTNRVSIDSPFRAPNQ